jgi:putative hydroxymethylpyrimidine transport system substrate-binding protein
MTDTAAQIRIILDWTLDAKHSIIWAADKEGCFKECGLNVELLEPLSKSASSLEQVHSGAAELAINYPHNILLMRKELPNLAAVGSMIKKNSEGLLSLRVKNIDSADKLKNMRIGIGPSPVSKSQFEVFLTSNGLSYQDIDLSYVGFEGEELLLKDEIDALDAVQYAIPRTEAKGHQVNFIAYTTSGVPDSPFLVFTGSADWVTTHGEDLKSFFACLKKGLAIVKSWDRKRWKSYTDACKDRTPDEEMSIWKTTLPLMDDNGILFDQNVNEIEKLQEILYQKGLLTEKYQIADIFINTYIGS